MKQRDRSKLEMVWDDGHAGYVSLRSLRDACPCAGCQGENVLLRTYTAPPIDFEKPGRYELTRAEPVGGYALRFSWADGHDHGLYTLEQLREMCECESCLQKRSDG